ncbi:MAG TPA: cache domain-containing protein [Vicinamibacterales bacterium]
MKVSRIVLCLVAVVVAAAALAATSHLPKTNSRAAVEAYVKEAAAIVQKDGASCATFASPEWKSADYYIFVSGPDSTLVCHPNAAVVGKPASSIVNKKGDKVGEMIVAKGKDNGQGWVEYMWMPPGKTTEELKSTYVIGVTGPEGKHYVVGGGGFNLK